MAAGEHRAAKGEVVVAPEVVAHLGDAIHIRQWRGDPASNDAVAVVDDLALEVALDPWPSLPPGALTEEQFRPWLLPAIYERQGEFLAELRPVVTLFLRFDGIDYDRDEAAGKKLDAYIRWMQSIFKRYQGSLLQLTIGDKGSYLYSAFGAPLAHGDDPERAMAAALELRAPPVEMDWIASVHIGIGQGNIWTGAYGGASRRTYGILGDEVNLAARLMQNAPSGQVLVSRAAQQAAADAFTWESLPPLQVKGKAEPIVVYRLVGAMERRAVRLQEPRYALPMVGREAELALVEQTLDQALAGKGQVLAVTAEAGMGKSRLVAEIIRRASDRQLAVYAGECQSYGTNTSYLVCESIWLPFFGLDGPASLDEQVQILETQLAAIDPALVPRLPLLGAVLSLPIPDNDLTSSLDAKLRKASLEALLLDCVRARTRAAPLLFVLEDCHWIDPLSDDLLELIGRAIADLPVLVVVAYRPPQLERTEAPRVTQLPYCTFVRLADFTPEESTRLIALKLAQLGGAATGLPATLVERITTRAQGNPFYIEELLNYLRGQRVETQDARALEELELPASLQSLILDRIDQLSESQKITLKVASVIGRLFRPAWLWGVYPQLGKPARVQADLEELSRLDMTPLGLPEPEITYLFKHIVTREVAYESLPYTTRALLHERLGQFIEQEYGEILEQYVDLLAYHYDLSHNEAKKREYLRKAGEAAQAAYANEPAIDYYRRLLPLLPEDEKVAAMLKLGEVLELVGKWNEAGDLYQQALSVAEQLGDRLPQARCQGAMGELLRKRGEYMEASAALEQARATFEELGDWAGGGRVLAELGELYRLQGHYADARVTYERSLELARVVTPGLRSAARATALKGAGTVAAQQGDYVAATNLYEESLAIHRELGAKPEIANLLNNLGIVARYRGDYAAATTLFEESLSLRRELGDRWGTATSLTNLGRAVHYQGDYPAARLLHQEAFETYRALGTKKGTADALTNLGNVVRDQGDYMVARSLYAESLTLYWELGDKWAITQFLEDLGVLAVAQSEPERALRLAAAAAVLREAISAPRSPSDQTGLERMLEPARQALGEASSALAWAEGRALTLEQAIAYALEDEAPA